MVACPAHDDSSPSLHISSAPEGALLHCFADCRVEAILSALGLEPSDLYDDEGPPRVGVVAPVKAEREVVSVERLAEHFQLPVEHLRSLGLHQSGRNVAVPFYGEGGEQVLVKYRSRIAAGKGPKYFYPSGTKLQPYGLNRLPEFRRTHKAVVLVEGESDVWSCWLHAIPALGLPGAGTVKCLLAEHLAGIELIYIVQEADAAGEKFVVSVLDRLQELGWPGCARVVEMPVRAKDPTELRLRSPKAFGDAFRALCAAAPEASKRSPATLPVIWMSEVEAQTIRWLWEPRIPREFPTMLAGWGGLGKSFICATLAALVTAGPTQGRVLYFAKEDDPKTVLRPRLERCGANLGRVALFDLRSRSLSWQKDLKEVDAAMRMVRPDLVIWDPIVSFFAGNPNRSDQVRPVIDALAAMAGEYNCGMLLVAHFAKGARSSQEAAQGSADWWNGMRSVLQVFEDPDALPGERRGIMAHAKHNLSPRAPSLRYVIEGEGLSARLDWCGESHFTAQQLASPLMSEDRDSVTEAKEWLRSFLAGGRRPREDVYTVARKRGFNRGLISRARSELGLKAVQVGMGDKEEICWALPDRTEPASEVPI